MFRHSLQSSRALLSHSVRRWYQRFPLQAELDKDAPDPIGYRYVLQRLANIAMNVTEKQPTKTLHVFPEEAFVKYLGKNSNLYLTGYDDKATHFQQAAAPGKYESVIAEESFRGLNKLPFPSGGFQLVLCAPPVHTASVYDPREGADGTATVYTPPPLPLLECIRVCAQKGYVVLGLLESQSARFELQRHLLEYAGLGMVDFLSLQRFSLPLPHLQPLPPHTPPTGGSEGSRGAGAEWMSEECDVADMSVAVGKKAEKGQEEGEVVTTMPGIKYVIAVLRKL
eukprot:gene25403-30675_t